MADSQSTGGMTQVDNNSALLSFNNIRIHRGPTGTALLHNPTTDGRIFVQHQVAEALQLCSAFRNLTEHKENIIQANPHLGEHRGNIQAALEEIARAGMFESAEHCWSRLTQAQESERHQGAIRVFIITCDRPEALRRLLSKITKETLPNNAEGIWVVDDSRDNDNVYLNRQTLVEAQKCLGISIRHVDSAARLALIAKIKATLPRHSSIVDWLLSSEGWGDLPTFGVARNTALVLSVGKRALVLDDDVIPNAVAPPLAQENFRFGSENDREAVFYSSTANLAAHESPLDKSPLVLMDQHLGRNLGAVVSHYLKSSHDLAGMDGALVNDLNCNSPILMTQCGSWGDPGTSDSRWIFHLPHSSLNRLLREHNDIASVVGSRSCWHGYRGPVISKLGTLSQLTGLDHRSLLPPYFPAGRGEDILFGTMLHRMHPSGIIFNEGWAINHSPMERRDSRASLKPVSSPLSSALLVDWLGADNTKHWGLSAHENLEQIANEITQVSRMRHDDLYSLIVEGLVSRRIALLSRCIAHTNQLIRLEQLPGYGGWKQFIDTSQDVLTAEIQRSNEDLFSQRSTTVAGSIESLQNLGTALANALAIWPSICKAAQPHI